VLLSEKQKTNYNKQFWLNVISFIIGAFGLLLSIIALAKEGKEGQAGPPGPQGMIGPFGPNIPFNGFRVSSSVIQEIVPFVPHKMIFENVHYDTNGTYDSFENTAKIAQKGYYQIFFLLSMEGHEQTQNYTYRIEADIVVNGTSYISDTDSMNILPENRRELTLSATAVLFLDVSTVVWIQAHVTTEPILVTFETHSAWFYLHKV